MSSTINTPPLASPDVGVDLRRVCRRRLQGGEAMATGHASVHGLGPRRWKMAIWRRHQQAADLSGSVHHFERGVQYRPSAKPNASSTPARYPDRRPPDFYDNAIAEASTDCFTTELLRPHGSWRGCDELELVTLKYVDWFTTDASTARSARSRPPNWKPPITLATARATRSTDLTESLLIRGSSVFLKPLVLAQW
jgi:hypothetical protein